MVMLDPLCEACVDDGRRTREPAYRGGPRRLDGDCEACPRCAVCDARLAESRDRALQLEGWDSYCGLSHLVEGMRGRTLAERALYSFDLLGDPALVQRDAEGLLGVARNWLAEFNRALLAVGAAAGSPAADADPGTLRSLAGVRGDVAVVTEMCVACDRVAARRLDLSGGGGDTAVWSLCDTHARLEAESIRREQLRPAHVQSAEHSGEDSEEERRAAPQLALPLRPALKKVRHSTTDRTRAVR